jgi:hypothetical protein
MYGRVGLNFIQKMNATDSQRETGSILALCIDFFFCQINISFLAFFTLFLLRIKQNL